MSVMSVMSATGAATHSHLGKAEKGRGRKRSEVSERLRHEYRGRA